MTSESTLNGAISTLLMTREEAEVWEGRFSEHLQRFQMELAEFVDREGWRALGFDSPKAWKDARYPDMPLRSFYNRVDRGRQLADKSIANMAKLSSPAPAPNPVPRPGRPMGTKDQTKRYNARDYQPTQGPLAMPANAVPDARTECDKCNGTGWITPSTKPEPKPAKALPFPTAPRGQLTAFWDLVEEISPKQRRYECSTCGHRYVTTRNGLGWPPLPAYCPGKCKTVTATHGG